jgi:hypothetical protein
MKITIQKQLLTMAAVAECFVGLGLIMAPGAVAALLLNAEADGVGLMIGRIAGVALFSLGISCWGARTDGGGPARTGTLRAITFYNVGAGLLLLVFAATGKAGGPVVWIVGLLHLGFGLGLAFSLRSPEAAWSAQPPHQS